MTPNEKRARFRELAKTPQVETGRQYERHHGQLEFDFLPTKDKTGNRRAQKKGH